MITKTPFPHISPLHQFHNNCHLCPMVRPLTNLPAKPDFHLGPDHLILWYCDHLTQQSRSKYQKVATRVRIQRFLFCRNKRASVKTITMFSPCWRARPASGLGLEPLGLMSAEVGLNMILMMSMMMMMSMMNMMMMMMMAMMMWGLPGKTSSTHSQVTRDS